MKYFNSYKLFYGKNFIKEYTALISANTAVMLITGLLMLLINNEHFSGFMTGFLPLACGGVAMGLGFGLVCAVFNGNLPAVPGYRFFHSIAGGAEHFKRAIVFSNIMSLFPIALYGAVGGLVFRHYIVVVMTVTGFFMIALTNLTSRMRTPWIRIGTFMIVGFAYGFYAGASGDEEEGIAVLPLNVTIIICAVVLALYIISLIVVTTTAQKRWNRED